MLRTPNDARFGLTEEPERRNFSTLFGQATRTTRPLWRPLLLAATSLGLVLMVIPGRAESQTSVSKTSVSKTSLSKGQASRAPAGKGKEIFESSCAICHGLDGGGGEHAPNIGRASAARSRSDADLGRVLHEGILGTGMPSFKRLGDLKLKAILYYLRFLQGKTDTQLGTGNPNQGQQLFFGKGQCADCHAIGGKGRFLSTDLSDFAYDHNPAEIRASIVNPQAGESNPRSSVSVTTTSGQRFSGRIRNENNSSLQMQDADGKFYLFMKSDLRSLDRSPAPAMPIGYQKTLSSAEIDDLVSYIIHQSPVPRAISSRATKQKLAPGD